MLLLNLMRMNGLTPKHSKHGPKRQWSASAQSPENEQRSSSSSGSVPTGTRAPRRSGNAAARSRRPPRSHLLSPGQLRHHTEPVRPAEADRSPHCVGGPTSSGSRAGSPGPGAGQGGAAGLALHDYWHSVSSVSDNDEVEYILDYNDTLFDMLLNTLSIEGSNVSGEGCLGPEAGAGASGGAARAATPPVQPWSPPSAPSAPHPRDLD